MPKFELRRLDVINGKQTFESLVVDEHDLLAEFESSLEERYRSEMRTLYAWMQMVADLCPVPGTIYHPLSDGKDGFREYEFKSKHLRIYAFAIARGKIIVMGGKKNRQRNYLRNFSGLKRQYITYSNQYETD